ncbi:MAG TPA: hypothetical protein PKW15_05310, partial [Alphaproteobacteria bacterium]|nr:hypothetical protein [Alphaproteobacteria bacterium]
NNLPVVSSSRPFIAPRMSLGMKVAIGFLALTGVMIAAGMMMTLSEIMARLEPKDQAQVAAAPDLHETEEAISEVANSSLHAYPVPDARSEAALALPSGAVVQQLMPYQGSVYLLVNVPKKGQRILILDAKSGNVKQDIRLQNAPK